MDTNFRATVLIPEIHLAAATKFLHGIGADLALIAPVINIAETFPGLTSKAKRPYVKRSHHTAEVRNALKKPTTNAKNASPRKRWSKAARAAASKRAKATWRAKNAATK